MGAVLYNDYTHTVRAIMRRLYKLHAHGMYVLVVFDGASSAAKLGEDAD